MAQNRGDCPSRVTSRGAVALHRDLIDRGLDLGLPFTGSAPDLGTFELR